MKVAIIGGGFTGLAAGIELVDADHEVVIFESGEHLGGLATGFLPKEWKWSLEKFYHHIFANDGEIIKMAKKVGHPAYFEIPETISYQDGVMAPLDSPMALLKYPGLSVWARLRMAMGLAILKLVFRPEWGMKWERWTTAEILPILVGSEAYRKIWEPLLMAKFGKYVNQVNMAWFWARIYKRTKSLGYFQGGFLKLAEKMVEYIESKKGKVVSGKQIEKITKKKEKWEIEGELFDKVIVTTPGPLVNRLFGKEVVKMPKIDYLWGQTVVLELSESLMDSYWLNVLAKDWPFLVLVEHTRFVDKKRYGGKTVIYLGNYLEEDDPRLKMNEKELLDLFAPYLSKVNAKFSKKWVKRMWKFSAPFAQPVFPVNYSRKVPKMKTKLTGVYAANMSMVYPWDRGTNYAVEIGRKVAQLVTNRG